MKPSFLPFYPFHVHLHSIAVNNFFKSIENQFDLLHIHFPLTPIIKTSIPIITTLHGSMIGNYENLEIVDIKSLLNKIVARLITYPLFKQLIDQSNIITTVSLPLAEELEKYYNKTDVKYIGNGIDTDRFVPKNNNNKKLINIFICGKT